MKKKTAQALSLILTAAILLPVPQTAAANPGENAQKQADYLNPDATAENPYTHASNSSDMQNRNEEIKKPEVLQAACPQQTLLQQTALPNGLSGTPPQNAGITYETTQDYVHSIYANGLPLLIVSSESIGYARLYIDANGNGVGDLDEEVTSLKGDGTVTGGGIYYSDRSGYFLTNSTVYGGAKEGTLTADTCITLSGAADPSDDNRQTLRMIYGGSQSGTQIGNTCVNISGGNVKWICGGSQSAELNGSTTVHITGGYTINNIYGGSQSGTVNGNTDIHIADAVVNSVYGGNENSGTINGNTSLTFEENTLVKGWVYGGGAGYSDDLITEVTGSANIIINGGSFLHNVYGGGAWRGAKTADSNITINGGSFADCWVYGGGEEESVITGRSSITVNGGSVNTVCAAGAGFNSTNAVITDSDIRFTGGFVRQFWTQSQNNSPINGQLSFLLEGDGYSDTSLYFGRKDDTVGFSELSIALKDTSAAWLQIQAPIKDKLTVSFHNASVEQFYMSDGVLDKTAESALSYQNCGSADGRWGTYVFATNYNASLVDYDNPLLTGSHLNKNQFTSITIKDSYLNFHDDSFSNDDNGLKTCAKTLILDGGALRLNGGMCSYMPDTVFLNNPLLIRSSNYRSLIQFDKIPDGSARIQWLNTDGTAIPEDMETHVIALTPLDNPDDTFTSAHSGYVISNDFSYIGDSLGNSWHKKSWYVGAPEKLCKCVAYLTSLENNMFFFPEGNSEWTVTLIDYLTGSTSGSAKCRVIAHRDTTPVFTYSVLSDKTTAPGAEITENRLTVTEPGIVTVQVDKDLNGKTFSYETPVYIVGAPAEDRTVIALGTTEDLTLPFFGIEFDTRYCYIYNATLHTYLDNDDYDMTLDGDQLKFTIYKDYLNSLAIGEYQYHIRTSRLGDVPLNYYDYNYTINIVLPKEVTNPKITVLTDCFPYDGKEKEPNIIVWDDDTVIPEDEYTVSYENNRDTGTATVIVTDKEGGNYIVNGRASFEITNDYIPVNGVDYTVRLNENGWTNSDFEITANEGFLLSYGNTLADDWEKSLTKTEETEQGLVQFYVKNTANGEISLQAVEMYRIDRTVPEVFEISFNDNPVKKLIHEISFGLLFRESIDVRISADDALSGIESIAYFLSDTILSVEELNGIEEWTNGTQFSVSAEDGKRVIVYVKVTDNAGNAVCFGSDGAEFDLKAPIIGGITDKSVCYTTQIVTVSDKNLLEVTHNGQSDSETIILPGNRNKTYVIDANDRVGNSASVTITMKPIKSLSEPIKDLDIGHVTSENRANIETVIAAVGSLDTTNATDEEMNELKTVSELCAALQNRISEAAKAADTEEINAVGDVTLETVLLSDETALESAKAALEAALAEYGENYTNSEKEAIFMEIDRIDRILISLQTVRVLLEQIAALPEPNTVSPDDLDIEKAVKEAVLAYESLTDHEKILVGTTSYEKLTALLAALTDYRITEGENGSWKKETAAGLSFRANGALEKFTGILIDGAETEAENYLLKEGSTILTLKAIYLSTLDVGTHTLTVCYTDGKTEAKFNILPADDEDVPEKPEKPEKPGNTGNQEIPGGPDLSSGDGKSPDIENHIEIIRTAPQTGDPNCLEIWYWLIVLSLITNAAFALWRFGRKKQ